MFKKEQLKSPYFERKSFTLWYKFYACHEMDNYVKNPAPTFESYLNHFHILISKAKLHILEKQSL